MLENTQGVVNMLFAFDEDDISKISDGYHTFEELYHHRMMLFAVICNTYKSKAWKSWLHSDGTMFNDYFIVGVETPKGDYTYHYHKDFWNMFDVFELINAPTWDGHKPSDIDRLLSILENVHDTRTRSMDNGQNNRLITN